MLHLGMRQKWHPILYSALVLTLSGLSSGQNKCTILEIGCPRYFSYLHRVSLIGSDLQPSVLRVRAELESLLVIGGHNSLHVLQ